MLPDTDTCYAALLARDGRFDGQFFTGVLTTGIYCRPVCPARTPNRKNVRFFATAAAASAAGLRACKRCRPDSLPGSRDWDNRSDLVSRALRLLRSGAADDGGVVGVARTLSVSERHLRRVMVAELGVGPLELARTRRAQTARLLIDQTTMTFTDVAFAAGFASLRQFNDVIREEFGETPQQLRARFRTAPVEQPGGPDRTNVTVRLRFRQPYNVEAMMGWLARHGIPGVDEVAEDSVATRLENGDFVTCRFLAAHVQAQLQLSDLRDIPTHVAAIRSWLDLDAAPRAIDDVLHRNVTLAHSVHERPGVRVVGSPFPFRAAALAVLGQQVSVAAARTLAARLCVGLTSQSDSPGDLRRFPTAAEVAAATPSQLAGIVGMPIKRATSLVILAAQVAAEDLLVAHDRELVSQRLLQIPGIGPWTVADIRMRALGDPDVWPPNDLVLRRVIEKSPQDCSPWRSYAAHHAWLMAAGARARKPAEPKEGENDEV